MYKVAKQNMLTPEAHLNSVCARNSRPHPQVRELFFFSLICKLAKIAYLKSTRRVNCAAGVRIYLYIYMYVVRGARSEFPSGAEIEPRAQSVMQAREEFCSRQELI